jgi:hypothetical protein
MDYTMWDSLSEKIYAGRTVKFTEHARNLRRKSRRSGQKYL